MRNVAVCLRPVGEAMITSESIPRIRDMQRGWCGWKRPIVLAVLAAAGLMAAGSAGVRGANVEVENLRVGFANNAQNNLFKVGTWTPVWVQLKGGSARFTGIMEVEVPDDDGTPTFFRQPVDIPPGSSVRVVTYARPGSRDPDFTIRLYDQRTGRRHGPPVEGSRLAQLTPVQADESLLLTLGKPSGVEQIPNLPGFITEKSTGAQELTVARLDAAGGMLPGRWYGFDAASAIVVDTNDTETMTELGLRGQALVDWVERGGHLIVAVGGNWSAVKDSALAPILPGVPSGQERLTALDLRTLDTFANAGKSISTGAPPSVMVTKLEQVESRGGKVLSSSGDVPLVVRGTYGFGRVTLVALDVDQKPFSDWADRALFWVKAIDIRRHATADPGATVRIGGGGARIYQTGVSDLATQLRMALEQFPGVKLIPFGWVAFFIFLYILLIGPGDYFFLKKVVKRMELTWVTFPLIVLTVSLVAYFAAYMLKGKELRVNKVDVLDIDLASGRARGSMFVNLFSPQNRDYDISLVPLALDGPEPSALPGETSAATASAEKAGRAPAGTEVLLTWLGVPEAGFGGMGGSSRIGFSSGGYASMPLGSSESLEGVRIAIWSTKLLMARWFGPAPAAAEADLVPVGTDRLSGTVTNRLGMPLKDAIVAFGKHVYTLGDLAAGETKRVELAQDRQLSGLLKTRYGNAMPDTSGNRARIERSDLMLALMFHDSQGTTTNERPLSSNPLRFLDLTGHLALDRPMLLGHVDRPAAQLVLGHAPVPPKVEQTTMVRVILPLGKRPGSEEN